MSVKAKITLIIWAIIALIWWWVIFVMSLISPNKQTTDIINQAPKQQTTKQKQTNSEKKTTDIKKQNKNNKETPKKTNLTKNQDKKQNIYPNLKWKNFTILAPKNTLSPIAWRFFQIRFKKYTKWLIKINFYDNLKNYDKDLTYKLATKDNTFDFALVPAYWFNHLNKITNIEFKISSSSVSLSNIFDYNFNNFINNNTIKAIPFWIDPIVGYAYSKQNLDKNQTFDSWKNFIINSPDRLNIEWNLIKMPIFLWYDKNYLNYIKNHDYSLFPIFDFILHYYFFKKSQQWAQIIKDFWTNLVYKTFDFGLYQRYSLKYKKYDFCKNHSKFCLLFDKKSNLVYGFSSDYNFLKKQWLNIFRKFRFNINNLQIVSLPLANFQAEYPAQGWILIINPNSKNMKYLGDFIKTYIILGQKNKLPFYKNIISPFVKNQKAPQNMEFLGSFLGRFLILSNMNINYPKTLSDKEYNFLLGNIGF